MKRNYEGVYIEILAMQEDIVASSSIDASKENIGGWNDDWLTGGQTNEKNG